MDSLSDGGVHNIPQYRGEIKSDHKKSFENVIPRTMKDIMHLSVVCLPRGIR